MLHPDQARIRDFRVVPSLPETLQPLLDIARNLWWSWHPEAVDLFTRLDRELWERTEHNPIKLLGNVDQQILDKASKDQSFLHAMELVANRFHAHNTRDSWFQRTYRDHLSTQLVGDESRRPLRIAYFSAEFGLTECFQIYSGGLGCLAGDHLKSASELGLPLCAVGLAYRNGYFHQYLNADGYQQERYPDLDYDNQPVRRVLDDQGQQLKVNAPLPGRDVVCGVWRVDVGRVPLYLLDTNLPENSAQDRNITRALYSGDSEMRIQQEIVLGIGGVRALRALNEQPTVFHLNEGHAAFISLERIAEFRRDHGVSFEEARQATAGSNLFTTHTPVPAGIDRFEPELVTQYLAFAPDQLGCSMDHLLGLGRANPFDTDEAFSMAILAIRCSQFANGVSKLHGHVSRDMWSGLWPAVPDHEVPIGHVTNGVHARTWISHELVDILNRYVAPDWQLDPTDHHLWEAINDIPSEHIWLYRQRQRESLITWVRYKLRKQMQARGATTQDIENATGSLSTDALTIGFARRFATYKRGTLLMHDKERLRALLNSTDRPVQILIAGKAHPADKPGKELIRELVKLSESEIDFRRIVFLEDYDMEIGRRLVQGCDIWLNTPRRGMEASGTSGMKAAMNGGINVSILDGWWDEAFDNNVGFAIGAREEYEDQETADNIESRALYDLLERQILPEFYGRNAAGVPKLWMKRVKASMSKLTPQYSTNRMVADYTERYYLNAHGIGESLVANELHEAKDLAAHVNRYKDHWPNIAVRAVRSDVKPAMPLHQKIKVEAAIDLGGLDKSELAVQLYTGSVTSLGSLINPTVSPMKFEREEDGSGIFVGTYTPTDSGRKGFTVRVVPNDARLLGTLLPGLITWDAQAPLEPLQAGAGTTPTPQHAAV